MITDTIDGVLIECDEDGFHLILSGGRAEYNFNVQGVAVELLKAVQRDIGPWHAEGEAVLAEMTARGAVFTCPDPEGDWMRDVALGAIDVGESLEAAAATLDAIDLQRKAEKES